MCAIPHEDIRWEGEDPGISRRSGHIGRGFGVSNATSHGVVPGAGRSRESIRDQSEKDLRPPQNGVVKNVSEDIEIRNTETLIKEVEKVFGASHPDLFEIEKAKKMLKEHEQALLDVIAKLADVCDDGTDGEQPFLHEQSTDMYQERRNTVFSGN
ncbi:unnamed protein product [Ilex paraguariensis]|uniref:Uncharacterized protein n=1 Tax=Ilex paraguariensis TaxID=185542 RepID=A0ABC8RU02_9AQUA